MNIQAKRTVFASTVGTIFEWYDFFIYGLASVIVFNSLFFPNIDPTLALIVSMMTYAVGLFARPVGAVIFGIIGDRFGRKHMLVVTMLLMGFSTFAIGLLPTYYAIGVYAPICLLFLRILQGIGLGGEWGGAAVMVQEHSPPEKQGFYTSFVQLGLPVGMLMATGIFAILNSTLTKEQFMDWGWRIPFLTSAVLVLIGTLIRVKITESPVFLEIERKKKLSPSPLKDVLFKYPKTLLQGIGLKLTETAWFFIVTNFTVAYLTSKFNIPKQQLLEILIVTNSINIVWTLVIGYLSDIIGKRNIFIAGSIFTVLFSFPMFYMIDTGDLTMILIAMILGQCVGSTTMFAILASYLPEIFKPEVRGTGSSISFQLGAALGGGLLPIAGAFLVREFGTNYILASLLVLCGFITLWAALLTKPKLIND